MRSRQASLGVVGKAEDRPKGAPEPFHPGEGVPTASVLVETKFEMGSRAPKERNSARLGD